jgi:thymidylate synthase (FAD)
MFSEAYVGGDEEAKALLGPIIWQLYQENPILFSEPEERFKINSLILLTRSPELRSREEVLFHRAMTVEFNNCCRGFTHEDVRSRNGRKQITSYTQESTRYVDYSRGDINLDEFQMKVILPYNEQFDFGQTIKFSVDKTEYAFTPQQFTNLMEGWYRILRKTGLKAEEARQWLPIGINAQIVQTFNLNEWRHWFFIRCGRAAHREIRLLAVMLLKESQRRFPGIFDDFIISEDGESASFVSQGLLV